jgi:ketosteroid isomerase-like protein
MSDYTRCAAVPHVDRRIVGISRGRCRRGLPGPFAAALPRHRSSRTHEIEDEIAEGDKVVTRLTARGTHTGELASIPATGNEMCMTATVIHRIADGRLVEKWSDKDVLAMLQQLNVIPPLR